MKELLLGIQQGKRSYKAILAQRYLFGPGVLNYEQALYWAESSLKDGDPLGKFYFAYIKEENYIQTYDSKKSRSKLQRSLHKVLPELTAKAQKGDVLSQSALGYLFYQGIIFPSDQKKAIFWLQKAVDSQYGPAQIILASLYLISDDSEITDRLALELFQKAAKVGYGEAEGYLGFMHISGRGLEQNYNSGISLLKRGSQKKDRISQNILGIAYREGYGTEKNITKAAELFKQAANQGNPWGKRNLGTLYDKGYAKKKDCKAVISWYNEAKATENSEITKDLTNYFRACSLALQ